MFLESMIENLNYYWIHVILRFSTVFDDVNVYRFVIV